MTYEELSTFIESRMRMSHISAVEGFNVGINDGEVAGQTIFHCHIHLIPRRREDVKSPRGGVRHVISGRGNY